jgi:MFS family permease
MLAVSLLAVELLAGMQSFLSQTVMPLVAAELDGAHLYGVLNASSQAAMFLTMPLGGWLLSRFRIGPLMLVLTLVTVAGAVVCALALSMQAFISGTVIRALAAGGLATVSMGAVARGLPPRHRQLVLAGMSGVWVVSSLVGPAYAASISSAFGWRWAMVAFLPVLLLVRMMIAYYMPPRSDEEAREKAPWGWAIVLATGALVLSVPAGVWSGVGIAAGGALMLWAARALLPAGSLRGTPGRPAALSALFVTTGVYFGAAMVLSVVAHDAFGLEAHQYGFIIAAPAFAWAILGLWCGAHPATGDGFRRRVLTGGAAVALAIAMLLATTVFARTDGHAWAGLLAGAGVLGLGMGMIYPDLLGRCFTPPQSGDGISQDRMATAVILAEAVGTALVTTVAYSWLGTGFGLVDTYLLRSQILYAGLLPLAVLMIHRLAAANPRTMASL